MVTGKNDINKLFKMYLITMVFSLYAALAHQLGEDNNVSSLRLTAANYMRDNSDHFVPFLMDPDTGDILNPDQFDEYCHKMVTTSAWGGQPEVYNYFHS